jgi:hypothetical protein
VITARTLSSTWEDAHGLGAVAVIDVLRGLCAERRVVTTTTQSLAAARLDRVLEKLATEVDRFDALTKRLDALTADSEPRPRLELVQPHDDDA